MKKITTVAHNASLEIVASGSYLILSLAVGALKEISDMGRETNKES